MRVLARRLVPSNVSVCSTTQTGFGCDIGRADAVIGALAMVPRSHQRAGQLNYQTSDRAIGSQV